MSVSVQNPYTVGSPGQIQRFKERFGLGLRTLQLRNSVRDALKGGVPVVAFADAAEFNSEGQVTPRNGRHVDLGSQLAQQPCIFIYGFADPEVRGSIARLNLGQCNRRKSRLSYPDIAP